MTRAKSPWSRNYAWEHAVFIGQKDRWGYTFKPPVLCGQAKRAAGSGYNFLVHLGARFGLWWGAESDAVASNVASFQVVVGEYARDDHFWLSVRHGRWEYLDPWDRQLWHAQVDQRAIGVEVNKVHRQRQIVKRIHVRVEHVRPSKCRQEVLRRVKENEAAKSAAAESGEKIDLKRHPVQPKSGYVYNMSEKPETIQALPFVDLV